MVDGASSDQWVYVVTDIEVDGPWPGPNSMRSFASVAVSLDGREHGRFEAVLDELPGAAANPRTRAWFETVPEAWAAATTGAQPVVDVLAGYVDWVAGLPRPRAFAASPLSFDGTWMDYYLRRFTRSTPTTRSTTPSGSRTSWCTWPGRRGSGVSPVWWPHSGAT